jgi:hypothetical protein
MHKTNLTMSRLAAVALLSLGLAACDSYSAPRYSISADNDVALKSMAGDHVAVSDFTRTAKFDPSCRLAGPIELPDGLTFEGYVSKAFKDELQIAGLYDAKAPVTLQGVVTDLQMSSNSGTWDISLTLSSSNGKSLPVSEHYDFHTSFSAISACHNAANAYPAAVQSLIGKATASPDFKALLTQ